MASVPRIIPLPLPAQFKSISEAASCERICGGAVILGYEVAVVALVALVALVADVSAPLVVGLSMG